MGRLSRRYRQYLCQKIGTFVYKKALEKSIYSEENITSILGIFEQNKRRLQKDLTDRFKKVKDMIKVLEDKASKQLEKLNNKTE